MFWEKGCCVIPLSGSLSDPSLSPMILSSTWSNLLQKIRVKGSSDGDA